MKKFLIIVFFVCALGVCAEEIQDAELTTGPVEVFQENNRFGLMSETCQVLVKPVFKKLIKVGDSAWICQKNNRFGMIDKSGNYLVKPKYRFADRVFGKYAKLGNSKDFGLYDETGTAVIAPEYTVIEPLRGGLFLTCKNYKYGVVNMKGEPVELPENALSEAPSPELTPAAKTAAVTGYSAVTAGNYFLKPFAIISPAYEQTIDELVYSRGADAVNVLMNFSWIPKFPHTYIRNYYNALKTPDTGPFSNKREELKKRIK